MQLNSLRSSTQQCIWIIYIVVSLMAALGDDSVLAQQQCRIVSYTHPKGDVISTQVCSLIQCWAQKKTIPCQHPIVRCG
jgi:hypothetical protein